MGCCGLIQSAIIKTDWLKEEFDKINVYFSFSYSIIVASFPGLPPHARNVTCKKLLSSGKAWSETSREVDVGWTPGGVAPALCACVRQDVKR